MSRLAFQPGPKAEAAPASLPAATNFSSQQYDYAPFQSPTYQVQPYRLSCRCRLACLLEMLHWGISYARGTVAAEQSEIGRNQLTGD